MKKNRDSFLFKLTAKSLKYFLLTIFGFVLAYILSVSFGAVNIVAILLSLASSLFLNLGIVLLCLMTTTVIVESLR
jgi:hypothetical protein